MTGMLEIVMRIVLGLKRWSPFCYRYSINAVTCQAGCRTQNVTQVHWWEIPCTRPEQARNPEGKDWAHAQAARGGPRALAPA